VTVVPYVVVASVVPWSAVDSTNPDHFAHEAHEGLEFICEAFECDSLAVAWAVSEPELVESSARDRVEIDDLWRDAMPYTWPVLGEQQVQFKHSLLP
jgi:hypothetical protein